MARILAGILTLLLAAAAASADYATGMIAYEQHDYVTAYENWRPLAQEGRPAAQYNMGHLFHRGLGVERNIDPIFPR